MSDADLDRIYHLLAETRDIPSPSGREAELRDWVIGKLPSTTRYAIDSAGNLILRYEAGAAGRVAICGHLDEIGIIVTRIDERGSIRIANVGGLAPWVWG